MCLAVRYEATADGWIGISSHIVNQYIMVCSNRAHLISSNDVAESEQVGAALHMSRISKSRWCCTSKPLSLMLFYFGNLKLLYRVLYSNFIESRLFLTSQIFSNRMIDIYIIILNI